MTPHTNIYNHRNITKVPNIVQKLLWYLMGQLNLLITLTPMSHCHLTHSHCFNPIKFYTPKEYNMITKLNMIITL